jgi:hypothetical protein
VIGRLAIRHPLLVTGFAAGRKKFQFRKAGEVGIYTTMSFKLMVDYRPRRHCRKNHADTTRLRIRENKGQKTKLADLG